MTAAITNLLSILDLERLEHNLYRGRSPSSGWGRVYGGQVISQALVAAQRTVPPERHVHSLHCYFMLGGAPTIPIVYQVDRLRDGGSFTTRRVTAIQNGAAIFSLECSFQVDEHGMEHQMPMPAGLPQPEETKTQIELVDALGVNVPDAVRRFWEKERPLEIRPIVVEHYTTRDRLPPYQSVWIRISGEVPEDRQLQSALLAYLSDMTLLDTANFAHGRNAFDPELQMASLDHAMWFHRPHPLDDWLLYVQDSPNSIGARGLSRGFLYSRDGRLIASVAQEGLIRLRTKHRK
ncbi:MAG: acyl-CoA thioesterase II [Rhizobiales bacterium 68-8]|nr:MAG: acyl-CoA thioesterase II [Rhizobiales bacterium 68-8]